MEGLFCIGWNGWSGWSQNGWGSFSLFINDMDQFINIQLRLVDSVCQLQTLELGKPVIRKGLLYFHLLENGGFIPRAITDETKIEWLTRMVRRSRIYLPVDQVLAELS